MSTLGDAILGLSSTGPVTRTGSNSYDVLATVSQAEAEAGSATTVRSWTAERVAQAIAALAPGGTSVPTGAGILWPTASIASPPTGFFAAGDYGTAAQGTVGGWSVVVKSAGTLGATTADPAGGSYGTTQSVTLTGAAGATIKYTTNGSTPGRGTGTEFTGTPITIAATTDLKHMQYKDGWVDSAVSTDSYTITGGAPTPSVLWWKFNESSGGTVNAAAGVAGTDTGGRTSNATGYQMPASGAGRSWPAPS